MNSPPTFSVRLARRVYALATRCWPAPRVSDLRRTFDDACLASWHTGGALAVAGMTSMELWDLVTTAVRARLARGGLMTPLPISDYAAPRSTKPPRRNWSIATELRQAWRGVTARRASSAMNVGLLALGLAVSATIFGIVDALILDPVPFPQAYELVEVWSSQPANKTLVPYLPRDLAARWMQRTDLFASTGASAQAGSVLVSNGDEVDPIAAAYLSPGLIETLGVRPQLGRTFTVDESHAGSDHVVLLSDRMWRSRFGASADVLGQKVRINDADYTIVGVMPRAFIYPWTQELWLPFSVTDAGPARTVTLVARMRAGLSRESLTAQIEAAGPATMKQPALSWPYPSATTRFVDKAFMSNQTRRSLWLLFGATALLLVTVCANVSNISMAQVFVRSRDYAIESALGASRARLIRQALLEQLIVGLLAFGIAWPLTYGALEVARGLLPAEFTLGSLHAVGLDVRVFIALALTALAAPIVAGLVPALIGSRTSVLEALKREGRSSTGTPASRVFRHALVIGEVASSVVLLVAAALLVHSFLRLQNVEKGFDADHLAAVNLGFPSKRYPTGMSRDLYLDRAAARIRQVPGVEAVTIADGVPPGTGGFSFGSIIFPEHPDDKSEFTILPVYQVRPDFFDTLRIPIKAGRGVAADDPATAVVVSESFAARFWPNQSALGQRYRFDYEKDWSEIVGVAGEIHQNAELDSGGGPFETYTIMPRAKAPASTAPPAPSSRNAIAQVQMAVRTVSPAIALAAIRQTLRQEDPSIVIFSIDTADGLFAKQLDRPRFMLVLMLVFSCAGLLLAAVGLYGVLSGLVAQRLREISVRLMLGAQPHQMARSVIWSGLALAGAGAVVGLVAAALLARTVSSILFEVQSHDVTSYVIVTSVLLLTAMAAMWRPARRAARTDPATLLRES